MQKKNAPHFGHQFQNPELLEIALVHKSYGNENRTERHVSERDNEQLEFLGDAILDLAISELLLNLFHDLSEGELSKLRASLVNERTLAELAKTISLGEFLFLGKGEDSTGGRTKDSILSGAFEALIAAIYKDSNYETVKLWIWNHFREPAKQSGGISSIERSNSEKGPVFLYDYKTRLQEISQYKFKETPRYEIVSSQGPDHDKTFFTKLLIRGKELGRAAGKSRKESEQSAAKLVLETFGQNLEKLDLKDL